MIQVAVKEEQDTRAKFPGRRQERDFEEPIVGEPSYKAVR